MGKPEQKAPTALERFLWTFPSTSIRLTLTQSPNSQGRIDLEYNATDKNALDAL